MCRQVFTTSRIERVLEVHVPRPCGPRIPRFVLVPVRHDGAIRGLPLGRNDFPRSAAISRWCEPGVTDDEHGSGGYPDRGGKRTWMRW